MPTKVISTPFVTVVAVMRLDDGGPMVESVTAMLMLLVARPPTGGVFTTCTTLLVLPRKQPSPAYSAVTVLEPCGSELVMKAATPLPSKVTGAPSGTPLVLNNTVPVGVPEPDGTALSVAVKVTFVPGSEGLGEAVRVLVVAAVKVTVAVCVTVTESVVSVAVKTSAAAVVDFTVNVTTPEASLAPEAALMVGVPEPEVFVRVTVLPDTGLLFTSFKVTVTVEVVAPSAVTQVGEADTADWAAVTAPAENTMFPLVTAVKLVSPAVAVAVNVIVSDFE